MLDTIALTLTKDDFMVTDYNRFSPSVRHLFHPPFMMLKGRGPVRCVQNPTRKELRQGIYKPRLTIIKGVISGGYTLDFRIEFSAPKLIFGNNFDELDEENFELVLETLIQRLHEMGVEVQSDVLRRASVSAVHFSKNTVLGEYLTSSAILRALTKLNMNGRLDLNKTDYRNDGHALRYHANSYEIVFYDKIKDLEQSKISKRRTIESDNSVQTDLLSSLPKPFEVLRMEVRLNSRTKIKRLCKKLGIKPPLTFEKALNRKTSQIILLHFWKRIMAEARWLQLEKQQSEDLLQTILRISPGIPTSQRPYNFSTGYW